jgi:hypothetical protein
MASDAGTVNVPGWYPLEMFTVQLTGSHRVNLSVTPVPPTAPTSAVADCPGLMLGMTR